MVQLDRDSETGRTVTDLTQELLEYLSQEAKGIAGLTENRKALLAEMEEERDATLEMLERLTQEAEKLVALRETALELLEKRTQEAEKISALNDIRVERDTEARLAL